MRAATLLLVLATSCTRLSAAAVDERALVSTDVPAGAFPKSFVDPLGRTVFLHASPRRIVSMSLVSDEIALALAPDRIAGLTYLVDDATNTMASAPTSIARIGEEPESILILGPDLVITTAFSHADVVTALADAGTPTLRLGTPERLDDVFAILRVIARATGTEVRAEAIIDDAHARIAAVTEHAGRRKPVRAMVWEGGISYGSSTLQGELLTKAGAVNVVAEAGLRGSVTLTEEALVALAPDVIFTSIDEPEVHPSSIGDSPIVAEVPAVRAHAVHGIPRRWLGSVSHHVLLALEAIDRAL